VTSDEELFQIPEYIDHVRHYELTTPTQRKMLRRADKMERRLGEIIEWKKS
jgi:hypothetical protein